jgi:hypothetical protein
VVLNLVLIGLAITLDPLPLTAFLVVLPSKPGLRKQPVPDPYLRPHAQASPSQAS